MIKAWAKSLFAKIPRRPMKAGLITVALTALGSLFIPNHYASDAAVLPGDPKQESGAGSLISLVSAISGGGSTDPSTSYTDILNSQWMADNLLKDTYEYQDHWFMFMPWKPQKGTLEDYIDAANHDKAVKAFSDIFDVSHDLKSGLVTIEATTRSPELSAAIARNALKHLDEFMNDNSQSHSKATAAFLVTRLEDAKSLERRAEDELLQFAIKNRGYHASNDPAVVLKGSSLEAELSLRRDLVHTIATNLEQALMQAKDDTPVVSVLDGGNLPIEKHSPHRALLILALGLLAALGRWTGDNWEWVKRKFKSA